MSKSLVKLIDYSLLPAAIIILGKFIGMVFTIRIFGFEWGIENIPNSFFSVKPLLYDTDLRIVSTYSDLIMYSILVVGFSIVLIQAVILHNTHISPNVLSKLSDHNLLGLVKSSFEVYHKAAIWTLFLWMSQILILINVVSSKTEAWAFILTLVVSILLSVFILRDVALEIEISKKTLVDKISSDKK